MKIIMEFLYYHHCQFDLFVIASNVSQIKVILFWRVSLMIDISLYLSVSCIKEFLKGVAIFLCPFITTLCYIRK